MSSIANRLLPVLQQLPRAEGDLDDTGNYTTTNWLIPEQAELIYGGLASVIVLGLLIWKAGPAAKKAFQGRTQRIQQELDDSATAREDAEAEAGRIRAALGDIDSERSRMLAEADAQAEALLSEGRSRLAAETVEMEAKADADIEAARSRVSDELRAEIARLASAAAEQVVARSLDDETRQRLIEDYVSRVGANQAVEVGR